MTLGNGITGKVSARWQRWGAGFGHIGREFGSPAERAWEQATETMFDFSQQYAHVVTGEMKGSGSFEVDATGREVTGRVVYDSDHAIFEEERGGSHAFLTRAWESTEREFSESMPRAWEAVVDSWS